jgi:hypothetical protein
MRDEVERLRDQYQFFHWHLAFSDVFHTDSYSFSASEKALRSSNGFDLIIGNPPWEKINLKDEEFFAFTYPEIANAKTKSSRKKLIQQLERTDIHEYRRYQDTQRTHNCLSSFFRRSNLFPLTGVSRVNLYSVFAETSLRFIASHGRVGLLIASGIATDENNKKLFSCLVNENRLVHVLDFENKEGLFPGIHRSYKFCLFSALGKAEKNIAADLAFFLTKVEQLKEKERHFTLSTKDLKLINPKSLTCPAFRSKREAEITKRIYRNIKAICLHNKTPCFPGKPKTPFNTANDSVLFQNKEDLASLKGNFDAFNCFMEIESHKVFLPLYEAKLIHQYNHRRSTFCEAPSGNEKKHEVKIFPEVENPNISINTRYWIDHECLTDRYPGKWFLVFRDITHSGNERTSISAIIPERPCGDTLSLITEIDAVSALAICSNMNSFPYDYVARQKIAGTHLNHWIWEQLPCFENSQLESVVLFNVDLDLRSWLTSRSLELTYTAWDLQPFAQDCGYEGPPFKWNEDRRFLLRCELDAAYFHLYSIQRDDVDYIMDTFPSVKRKDEKAHGHYRTKNTILQIYDAMATAIASGQPYQTLLDPPPADPRVAHPARE